MFKLKLFSSLLLIFFLHQSLALSQNEKDTLYVNFSIKYGITSHIKDEENDFMVTLGYTELSAGIILSDNHEVGIRFIRNDFNNHRYVHNPNTSTYYRLFELGTATWYGIYYKFSFKGWFLDVTAAGTHQPDAPGGYTVFSAGREFNISKKIFLLTGLNFAITSYEVLTYTGFSKIYHKHLIFTTGISFKL